MPNLNTKPKNELAPGNFAPVVATGTSTDDLIVPRINIHRGDATDNKRFGPQAGGTLVDATDGHAISNAFMPISGRKVWTRFDKGDKAPQYVHENINNVPPADLEWGDDGTPPAAAETFEYVVAVKDEPTPYLVRFKRSSIKAGKVIHTNETRRGMAGKTTPGMYELTVVENEGSQGSIYYSAAVRVLGDPDAELLAAASGYAGVQVDKVKTTEDEDIPF